MKMNIKMNTDKSQLRFWVVLVVIAVVYNVIALALPFPKNAVFIISYLFTMIAIAAQVYVIRTAFFQGEGIKSKFYGFPIAKLGVIYLAVQLVLGFLFMALGAIVPLWLPLILYILLLGASVIGLIAVDAVREESQRQDTVLKKNVDCMRHFQAQTKSLANENQMPEVGEALRKLAEELSYKLTAAGKDILRILYEGNYNEDISLTDIVKELSSDTAERKALMKKLRGVYAKDMQTLLALGIAEKEASDYAYLSEEAVNGEKLRYLMQVAGWKNLSEVRAKVNAAVIVDESIKVTAEIQ